MTAGEGKHHVRRVLDQLEAVRWQLAGIAFSLPEPLGDRLEDVDDEVDAQVELRTTIQCVLEDAIRPALQDLQDVLGVPLP
ncbi:MAG TPA: hypothetical protein VKK31_18355 [Thermoanaerobaculia bacterium]|nr:hypothetical protein [Thermoanaerobaculia bacterium]